jgi:hypothetical protein
LEEIKYPSGVGGGLLNTGTAMIVASTVANNSAVDGGGIENGTGAMMIMNSTVSGNMAPGSFGNILPGPGHPSAGGILNLGTIGVIASTIANNTGVVGGGGLVNDPSSASPMIVIDSIVAGNGDSPRDAPPGDIFGAVSSSSTNNLIGTSTGLSGISNGIAFNRIGTPTSPIDPHLGPLTSNGGPTQTLAPLAGSPAIDTSLATPGLSTDQRGIARPQGPATDIGAVEAVGLTTPPPQVIGVRSPSTVARTSRVIVSFNQPLVASTAGRKMNFRLSDLTHPRRPVAIVSAKYDASTGTVTLALAGRLSTKDQYGIRINGSKKGAVTSLYGGALDGSGNGMPGSDYVATFKVGS